MKRWLLKKGSLFTVHCLLLILLALFTGVSVNKADASDYSGVEAARNEAVGHEFISGASFISETSRLEDYELNLIMGRMLVAETPNDEYEPKIILWDEWWRIKEGTINTPIDEGQGNRSINSISFSSGGKR